jgi:hypothetical protein
MTGIVKEVLEEIVSECVLNGGQVTLAPGYEVPEGCPHVAVQASYPKLVELYVIMDLKRSERPYLDMMKGMVSLHHVKQELVKGGETRRIFTQLEGSHSPVVNWAELLSDNEFLDLYDRFFPQNENAIKEPAIMAVIR